MLPTGAAVNGLLSELYREGVRIHSSREDVERKLDALLAEARRMILLRIDRNVDAYEENKAERRRRSAASLAVARELAPVIAAVGPVGDRSEMIACFIGTSNRGAFGGATFTDASIEAGLGDEFRASPA